MPPTITRRQALLSLSAAVAPLSLDSIRVRDPYIVAHKGVYYLYVQKANRAGNQNARGVEVFRSSDLMHWTQPSSVLDLPPDYWGGRMVWAPEVHYYRNRFFLFVTLTADEFLGEREGNKIEKRGTQIFHARSPMGPFRPFSNRAHTPADWPALDGTLYVETGVPYMIFCREWIQIEDGTIELMRLKKDLSGPDGAPKMLFHASDGPWVRKFEMNQGRKSGYVTDGPFLHKTQTGKLLMIWSSFGEKGYAIGVAASQWGSIHGPWIQQAEPLFKSDGGHGMILRTFDRKLKLVLHQPNINGRERARLFDLDDSTDQLLLT